MNYKILFLTVLTSLLFSCKEEEDAPQTIVQNIIVKDSAQTISFEPSSLFWYASQAPDSIEIAIKNGTPPYVITSPVTNGAQIKGEKLVFYPLKAYPDTELKSFINILDNAGNISSFNYTVGTLLNRYNTIDQASIEIKTQSGFQIYFEDDLSISSASWNQRSDFLYIDLDEGDMDFTIAARDVLGSGTYPLYSFFLNDVPSGSFLDDYELTNSFGNSIKVNSISKNSVDVELDLIVNERFSSFSRDLIVRIRLSK